MEANDAAADRWTCEACGCNTNIQSDRSCTICGTSHAGPSLLRRGGAGLAAAARAGWFVRGLTSRRGLMQDDVADIDDEDAIWESVVDGVGAASEHPESVMDSLVLEVSEMANATRSHHLVETNRQRFLDAAMAFAQINAETSTVDPSDMLRAATANTLAYQPRWVNPSQLASGRGRGVSSIEVGEGERQRLAHVPAGAEEGRAIRAEDPMSVGNMPNVVSFNMSLTGNNTEPRRRNVFGFRVAFDHSTCGNGGNMGGCYLIGVTTASFTSYGEHNALQQTPFFWGVEDSGRKYEGSRRPAARSRREVGFSSAYASDLSPQEVPMNAANVLFGCGEVVTVVCDLDNSAMAFWRDETMLGTLINTLPRGSNLYPVAVPFNRGVTVAITGMDGDPLALLRAFASDWQATENAKQEKIRLQLTEYRSTLINNGMVSPAFRSVLATIFSSYSKSKCTSKKVKVLQYTEAARLWYRCGMTLTALRTLMREKNLGERSQISFEDFLSVLENFAREDETNMERETRDDSLAGSVFRVGDRVELVEGYAKYDDASGGPLQPGDRGLVVDLQSGLSGERRSVRVLFGGRRWWYHPQAVQSERSGLVDTPAIWFFKKLLRVHGFDYTTLRPLSDEVFRVTSCHIGDLVKPKLMRKASPDDANLLFGRIVMESVLSTNPVSPRSRDSGTVLVEFIHQHFAEATGVGMVTTTSLAPVLEVRRVRANKLSFANALEIFCSSSMNTDATMVESSNFETSKYSERFRLEIASLSKLDRSAIEYMIRESTRSSKTLASLFSAGLPDAVLSAIDVAEKQMDSLDSRDDIVEKIGLIGKLCLMIANQLFAHSQCQLEPCESDTITDISAQINPSVTRQNNIPRRLHGGQRRLRLRDVSSQRETRIGEEASRGHGSHQLQAYHQRRSMLLSLISRARHGANTNYLNELIERENAVLGLSDDLSENQNPSLLGSMHGVAPSFALGSQNALVQDGQWGETEFCNETDNNMRNGAVERTDGSDIGHSFNANVTVSRSSILYNVLRCGVESSGDSSSLNGVGTDYALFARHLVTSGILLNNVVWIKAFLDAQAKKTHLTSAQKSSSILRGVVDEEGTPLLQLAIAFGCSPDVVSFLISRGAVVGPTEVKEVASSNQPALLSILLQHTSYRDDYNVRIYSSEIVHVFTQAKLQQDDLDTKMRATAGNFMVRLLKRLLSLGLSARRHNTFRMELCRRSIAEIFVGNVLLPSLKQAQRKSEPETSDVGRTIEDVNEREVTSETVVSHFSQGVRPMGLLSALSVEILEIVVLSSAECTTTFLSFVEDYLCSKDMSDIASGLTILLTLLTKLPQLRSHKELDRFGIAEFLTYHDAVASSFTSEILSKQASQRDECPSSRGAESPVSKSTVLCPKKHIAVIHITRHSSFRCDICGRGVERGRPMHGCRDCDWDACEHCTDKAESGLVKSAFIKGAIANCLGLLSNSSQGIAATVEDETHIDLCLLSNIASRLMQREVMAMADLCSMLKTPGSITFHEALHVVLPTLHNCFVGRSLNDELDAGHRNKKARVGDEPNDCDVESLEQRLLFCKEAVRVLVFENKCSKTEANEVGTCTNRELNDAFSSDAIETVGKLFSRTLEVDDSSANLVCSVAAQELLRRLHQILTLRENAQVRPLLAEEDSTLNDLKGSDLRALTRPIEVKLHSKSCDLGVELNVPLQVCAEPLVSMSELKTHILRSVKISDSSYVNFCVELAQSKAVIVERKLAAGNGPWKIAEIQSFDENTGAHVVRYGQLCSGTPNILKMSRECSSLLNDVTFQCYEDKLLVLAAREYYVLWRSASNAAKDLFLRHDSPMQCDLQPISKLQHDELVRVRQALGLRVACSHNNTKSVMTLIGYDNNGFNLVDDEGVMHTQVLPEKICLPSSSNETNQSTSRAESDNWTQHNDRATLSRTFPLLAVRQRPNTTGGNYRGSSLSKSNNRVGVLKRCWSALSLAESMRPVDLMILPCGCENAESSGFSDSDFVVFDLRFGDVAVSLVADSSVLDSPPNFQVTFSAHDNLSGLNFQFSPDITLISALKQIHESYDKNDRLISYQSCDLYFSVVPNGECFSSSAATPAAVSRDVGSFPISKNSVLDFAANRNSLSKNCVAINRSRKLSFRSFSNREKSTLRLCDGLDDISMSCMEIISLLSEFAQFLPAVETNAPNSFLFSSSTLSKKLLEQLDDTVSVVGQALPDWCTGAPSFAPRVFSYDSRRTLLERSAFGVSRSILKQQEAKVNVSRLRQRMASLRARAVELVSEAFSGGAEDPTALQLQADELYGMEETLAARVRASFRAVKWEEHTLQVAKAVIRRDYLLVDAMVMMNQYANDVTVKRRRLEVRFQGESGFDAASGNEAGVTRGFYADVAEALISSDVVAGVLCAASCDVVISGVAMTKRHSMDLETVHLEPCKLPLWIPDMDSSSQVVIPTPRANERSSPGVYPRPLPSYHPQMPEVLRMFQFMGRLFAAALRDGFMFPLPLSSSFLKLVQLGEDESSALRKRAFSCDSLMTSADLPRPGFLAGEIFAADAYICKALDIVDLADPLYSPLDKEKKYQEIARDQNFARVALGKSYDCSFEDYFQDRSFVDPLDPTQGADAVPLCPKGHNKTVTIYNVREWVALCKNFFLHDGVIAQAMAFREGVEDFFSADYLRLFTPDELQRDVCGGGDSVNTWDESAVRKLFKIDGGKGAVEALVAVAAIGGEGGAALSRRFSPNSPTVTFLVKALVEASPKQRRQFLSFVTSVPIGTPGQIEIIPIVSPSGDFLPMHDPSCLPRANTCARRLYLPKFDTYECFSHVLWAVVREESKFKGFFEWRGNT